MSNKNRENVNKMKTYILKFLLSLSVLLSFNSFAVDTISFSENCHYDSPNSLVQHSQESSPSHRNSLSNKQSFDTSRSSTEQIRIYNDVDSFSSLAELVRPGRGAGSLGDGLIVGGNRWGLPKLKPKSIANRNLTKAEYQALNRSSRIATKGGIPTSYKEFSRFTRGRFTGVGHQGARSQAWRSFAKHYDITRPTRSMAQRSAYLKQLYTSRKAPKWMNNWLKDGRVPPGHAVDHIKPLSIGGDDLPINMRLMQNADHDLWHSFYHPWR